VPNQVLATRWETPKLALNSYEDIPNRAWYCPDHNTGVSCPGGLMAPDNSRHRRDGLVPLASSRPLPDSGALTTHPMAK
jgi:hypothetical protein